MSVATGIGTFDPVSSCLLRSTIPAATGWYSGVSSNAKRELVPMTANVITLEVEVIDGDCHEVPYLEVGARFR